MKSFEIERDRTVDPAAVERYRALDRMWPRDQKAPDAP